ncbi:MAG: hypothetical protein GY702_24780 [Desulfobulbaceae bacterium]|nr:hypothetical protein [Desulfobulbaceae bacterium]
MIELWRRIFLLLGLSISICMFFYADLSPRISFKIVDFAVHQKNITKFGFSTEKKRYLTSLPISEYIKETISNSEYQPDDHDTITLLGDISSFLSNPDTDSEFERFRGSGPSLWLKPSTISASLIHNQLSQNSDGKLYYHSSNRGSSNYLVITINRYSREDFAFGDGFTGSSMPPENLFFPLRQWSYMATVLGIFLYIFLPQNKKPGTTLSFSKWRIVVGDTVSMIFFALFFSLPFFITGALQAFPLWWIIALFLWPLALCGVWMLKINGWFASFNIDFIPDGIHIDSFSFDEKILFHDLEKVSPANLKTPKWLIWLMALGTLAGRGSDQARMAGQTLLLSSANYGGYHFIFKDGRNFFLWCRDQFGNETYQGIDSLLKILEKKDLYDESEITEKRSLATEVIFETADGKKIPSNRNNPFLKLTVAAILPLIIFISAEIFLSGGSFLATKSNPQYSAKAKQANTIPLPTPPYIEITDTEKNWLKTIGGGRIVYGSHIIPAGNNNFVISGQTYDSRSDLLIMKAQDDGRILWKKQIEIAGNESPNGLVVTSDNSTIIAATKGPIGYRDILLIKHDSNGEILWQTQYGEESTSETAIAAAIHQDDTMTVLASSNYQMSLIKFSSSGSFISSKRLETGFQDVHRISATDIMTTDDNSLLVCGSLERPGASFIDAFLLKLDIDGNVVWNKRYEEKGREGLNVVRQLPDGGFLATGHMGLLGEGQQNILILKISEIGEIEWKKIIADKDDNTGIQLTITEDKEIFILGKSTLPYTSIDYSTLHRLDFKGNIHWQRWLGTKFQAMNMVYGASSQLILSGKQGRDGEQSMYGDLMVLNILPDR